MKVWPKNDEIRKLMKHSNGTGFRAEGPAEWPDDSFTARRVRDGDVLLKEPTIAKSSTASSSKSRSVDPNPTDAKLTDVPTDNADKPTRS